MDGIETAPAFGFDFALCSIRISVMDTEYGNGFVMLTRFDDLVAGCRPHTLNLVTATHLQCD